jgi:hypothetical protein
MAVAPGNKYSKNVLIEQAFLMEFLLWDKIAKEKCRPEAY